MHTQPNVHRGARLARTSYISACLRGSSPSCILSQFSLLPASVGPCPHVVFCCYEMLLHGPGTVCWVRAILYEIAIGLCGRPFVCRLCWNMLLRVQIVLDGSSPEEGSLSKQCCWRMNDVVDRGKMLSGNDKTCWSVALMLAIESIAAWKSKTVRLHALLFVVPSMVCTCEQACCESSKDEPCCFHK